MRIEEYREMLQKQDSQSLVGILATIDGGKFPEREAAVREEILRRKASGGTSGTAAYPPAGNPEPHSDFVARWVTFHLAFYSYLIIGACLHFESLWYEVPFAIGAIAFAIAYFVYLTCPFCKRYPKDIITFLPSIPFVPPRKCKHCQRGLWSKEA